MDISISMISGFISGIVGKSICYPIDTIKAQIYIQRSQLLTWKQIGQLIQSNYQLGGLRQFYKGGLVAIIGSGPAFSLYMSAYHKSKQLLPIQNKGLLHLSSGFMAEIVSCILWLPIDVVKERMQVQKDLKLYNYSGSLKAISSIVQQEGVIGLYRGFGATLGFFGPYSALYFYFYEAAKTQTSNQRFSPTISAGLACIITSLITHPLAVSKVRIQVQYRKGHNFDPNGDFKYKHQLHAIYSIYSNEGLKALFRGFFSRLAYVGVQSVFNMSLFEELKRRIENFI